MKKRLLSAFLALSMIFSVIPIIPITAFADPETYNDGYATYSPVSALKVETNNGVVTKIGLTTGEKGVGADNTPLTVTIISSMKLYGGTYDFDTGLTGDPADTSMDFNGTYTDLTMFSGNTAEGELNQGLAEKNMMVPAFQYTANVSNQNVYDDTTTPFYTNASIATSGAKNTDPTDEMGERTVEGTTDSDGNPLFTPDALKISLHAMGYSLNTTEDANSTTYFMGPIYTEDSDGNIVKIRDENIATLFSNMPVRIFVLSSNVADGQQPGDNYFYYDATIPATGSTTIIPGGPQEEDKTISSIVTKIDYDLGDVPTPTSTTPNATTVSGATWKQGTNTNPATIDLKKPYSVTYTIVADTDYTFTSAVETPDATTGKYPATLNGIGNTLGTVSNVTLTDSTHAQVTVDYTPIYVTKVEVDSSYPDNVTSSSAYTIPSPLKAEVTFGNGQSATFHYSSTDGSFNTADGSKSAPYLALKNGTSTVTGGTSITPTSGQDLAIVCDGSAATSDNTDITCTIATFSFASALSAIAAQFDFPVIGAAIDDAAEPTGTNSSKVTVTNNKVVWTDANGDPLGSTFNYDTEFQADVTFGVVDSDTDAINTSTAVTFIDDNDPTSNVTANFAAAPIAKYTWTAIASPSITARSGGDYDYYDGSGAPQTFTLTQADSVFTNITSVEIEGVSKTDSAGTYYSITGTGNTRTLTITKAFLDAVAEAKLADTTNGGIDAINTGSTPDKWTVTVNFAGNGKAVTGDGTGSSTDTRITAVNTTPYLTVTNPTETGAAGGKSTITVSSDATDVTSSVKHTDGTSVYKLTKGTAPTLTYNNAPAHTTGYKWTVYGTQETSFSSANTKTLSAPADGTRITASAVTEQPTRTITVTFDSAGTGTGKVAITPATALAGSSTSPVPETATVTVYADEDVTLTPTADSGSVVRSATAGTGTTVSGTVGTAAKSTSNATITFKFDSKTGVTMTPGNKDYYVQSKPDIVYTFHPGDYTTAPTVKIGNSSSTATTASTLATTGYTITGPDGSGYYTLTLDGDSTAVVNALSNSTNSAVTKNIFFDFGDGGVKSGTISVHPARSISNLAITSYTHGDKLNKANSTISFTLNSTGTDAGDYVYALDTKTWTKGGTTTSAPTGLSIQVGDGSGIAWTAFETAYIDTAATMYRETNSIVTGGEQGIKHGTKIKVSVDGNADEVSVTVNPKTLGVTVAASSFDKYFNNNSDFDTSVVTVVTHDTGDVVSGDTINNNKFSVTAGEYYDENTFSTLATNASVNNRYIKFTVTSSDGDAANYTITPAQQTAKINPIPITITKITPPNAVIGDTASWTQVTTTNGPAVALGASGNATTTATGVTSLPTSITLGYWYKYTATTPLGTLSNGVDIGPVGDATHAPTLSDTTNYTLVGVPNPVDGYVDTKSVQSISIKTSPKSSYQYGVTPATSGTLSDDYHLDLLGTVITLNYGSSTEDFKYTAHTSGGGSTTYSWDSTSTATTYNTTQIPVTWVKAGSATVTDGSAATQGQRLSPIEHNGAKLQITYNPSGAASVSDANKKTVDISVAKADLSVTVAYAAGKSVSDMTKDYDGKTDAPSGASSFFTYTLSGIVAKEPTGNDDVSIAAPDVTVTYANEDVERNSSTGAVEDKALSFALAKLSGNEAGNYNKPAITTSSLKGKINPVALTVTTINNISPATQYNVSTGTGTKTSSNEDTANVVTYSGIPTAAANDKIYVTFGYQYKNTDINNTATPNTDPSYYDVKITSLSFDPVLASPANDNGNYTITGWTASDPAQDIGHGGINGVTLQRVVLTIPSAQRSYTYIDNQNLNLMGATVDLQFSVPTYNTTYIYGTATGTGTGTGWFQGSTVPADINPITPGNEPFKLIWNSTSLSGTAASNGQNLTPTLLPSGTGKLRAIHTNGTASEPTDITIAKKEIEKIVAEKGTATVYDKVYNYSADLLPAHASDIKYTVYYTPTSTGTQTSTTSEYTVAAKPQYSNKYYNNGTPVAINFSDSNFTFTSDIYKTPSSYKGSDIESDSGLEGTINQRAITVTLDNSSYASTKQTTETDWTTTLTSGTNYTVALTASSVNGSETNALANGDGVGVEVKATFGTHTKGDHADVAVTAGDNSLTGTDTAAIASYNLTPATGNIHGKVTEVTNKLTVNSAHGTVKVFETANSSNVISAGSDGKYALEYGIGYTVEVSPANPTSAGGYRVSAIAGKKTSDSNAFSGTAATDDATTAHKATFEIASMPNYDLTVDATFKQNPNWGTPAPGNIDKKDTAGSYSFKYVGDFVPTTLKIGELTYDLAGTDSAYLNTSTKTISIPNSVFNAATALGLGTQNVELEFNDSTNPAPIDNTLNKLTKSITVSNTTTSVTSVTVDTSPTQTGVQKTYGDKLALDGFVFHTKRTKTGETPVINYYYYVDDTDTWKKISKSAETAPTTADWADETGGVNLATDNITLEWSDNKADTGLVSGTNVLFNSKHDGNKVKISWVDENSATKTAETAAWQVQKATLTFGVTSGTITKTYDGSADIDNAPATTNKDGITVTPNGAVNSDTINATVKSGTFITSISDKTANKNQGTNKPIQLLFNLSGNNLTEYKTASVETIGTSTDLEDLSLQGDVNKKTINITDVKIPSVKPSAATDAERTKSVSGNYSTVSPSNLTATGIVSTDNLTFSVTGLYDTPLVESAKPTFTKTSAADASSIAAGKYFGEVTGTDADNYTWNWAATAEGLVETSNLTGIIVKTQPSQTDNATKAVHGDNLDLKDLVVSLTFKDPSFNRDVPYWDATKNRGAGGISDAWTAEGMTITLDGANASNATVLRHDDNNDDRLVISRTGKPAGVADAQTDKLIVDKFTINAKVAVSPEKDYDGTNAITGSPSYTITFVHSGSFPAVAGSGEDNVQVSDAEAKLVYSDIHADDPVTLKAESSNAYAEFAWKTGTDAKITKNYTIEMDSTQAEQSGKINKRKIDITAIKIDDVDEREDRASELKKSKAAGEAQITASSAPSDFTFKTADGYYSTAGTGDTIDITYSATYTDVTLSGTTAENKTVAWVSGPASSVSGNGNANDYTITFPANASGKVNPKVLTALNVDSDNMDKSYIHGDSLNLDGLRLELVYGTSQTEYYVYGTNNNADNTKRGWFRVASSSASVPTGTSDNALTGNPPDISFAWSDGADTTVTPNSTVRYDSDRYSLKSDGVTKTGRIVVKGATGSEPITRNIDVDVLRKPAKLIISGNVSKIYDGDKALNSKTWTLNTDEDNAFKENLSFDWHVDSGVSDIISDDTADMVIKKTDTLAKLFFNTKNTDANTLTKSNGNALDRSDLVYTTPAIAANYDITVELDPTKFKAEIKKKKLSVTNVKKPEVIVDDHVSGTVDKIKKADYTTKDLIVSEDVEIQYDYTFTSTAVAGTYILASTSNAKITYDTVAPGMNYELVFTAPTQGIVHNKRITLVNITPHTKTKYEHGDALDLTGSVITLAYKDGNIDTETFTYNPAKNDWENASGTSLPTNVVVDWKTNDTWNGTDTRAQYNAATGFSTTKMQRYDDTDFDTPGSHTKTLALYYKNEGGEVQGPIYAGTVEVSQKKIQAVTINGNNFEKIYDATPDATIADQTATVTDPTTVLVMKHDNTTRDNVEIEITGVAYPSADANVEKDGTTQLDPATGLYKMQYTLGFKSGTNDNGNYILAVDPTNSSQVKTNITGTIKPRPITFSYAPVSAVVANNEADSPKTVKMSNKTIGDTAENIQIDTNVNTMPDEDIAKFRATYNATYSVDHIKNQKATTDPDYLLDVITGTATANDPTFTGIKGTNYDFKWPKLTPKLVLNAQSISALTANYTATFTHGDPLKFGGDAVAATPALSFEVIYTNGKKAEYTYDDTSGWEKTVKVYDDGTSSWTVDTAAAPVNLNDEGITLVWESTGDEVADNDPVLMYEHTDIANGKRADKILIHALSTDAAGYKETTTGNIYILPKNIYVKAEATNELDKFYDSETEIEDADRPNIKFTFYTDAAGANPYTKATATTGDVDKIRIQDKTDNASDYWKAEYYDNTASKTTKHVNWHDGIYKGTVDPWAIKLSNINLTGNQVGTTSYTYADSYNLINADAVLGEDTLSGKINPLAIDVEIKNTAVEPIFVDTPAGERTELKLPADQFIIRKIADDEVSGDVIYNYPSDTTPRDSVAITDDGTSASPLKYVQGATGNSDGNNYLYTLKPNNLFGQIKKIVVDEISVTTSPKTNYTHGDTLSLKDMVVHTKQNDKKEVNYIYIDDGTNKGWAVKKTEATPTYGAGDILAADKVPFTYDTWVNGDGYTGDDVTPPIDDRMTHSGQDKSKIKVIALDEDGNEKPAVSATTATINVDPKEIYIAVSIKPGNDPLTGAAYEIVKIYNKDASIGNDANGTANISKLKYDLKTLNNDGVTYDDFTPFSYTDDGGNTHTEQVTYDADNASGVFVASNSDDTANPYVQLTGGIVPLSTNDNSDVANKRVIIKDVDIKGADVDNGNYKYTPVTYDLTGKILKREVKVAPASQGYETITSTTKNNDPVNIVTWGLATNTNESPFLSVGDDRDADFITVTWQGTYNNTVDPSIVAVDANSISIANKAGSGKTRADNYILTNDAVNLTVPSSSVHEVVATGLEITGQPKFVTESTKSPEADQVRPTHGDALGNSDWDGLEFKIIWDDGKTTYHKLKSDGTWDTDSVADPGTSTKYTDPDDNPKAVSFAWNGGAASTNTLPGSTVARKDKDNQLSISVSDENGAPITKTTNKPNVNPKQITVKLTGNYTKPYDGNANIPNQTITLDKTAFAEADRKTSDPTVSVPVKFVAGAADKRDQDVEIKAGTNPVEYSKPVALAGDNLVLTGDYASLNDCYKLVPDISEFTGAIEPKELKVKLTIPGRSNTDDTTFTVNDDENFTTADKVGGDTVKIGYTGTYTKPTATGEAAVTVTDLKITSDDNAKDNYDIKLDGEPKVTVTIPTSTNTDGGGGGGGSVNTLTVHYKNEDGTAGDDVSSIYAPLGTDPVDLMGVFKQKIKDQTVLWTSSDESVATVDENGHVTFVGEGTATITAQSKTTKSLKDTVQITISPAPVAPTMDPNNPGGTATPTPRPVYEKTDSLITKTMLNPYIVGYDDYVFGPELPISREELATIFARLIANDLYMDQAYDTSFPDVPEKWSKPYIGYLEGFNVVTGYEDGNFRPENYITRAEMAVMMAKAEGYNLDGYVSSEETGFPDMDEGYSTWAAAKAIKILTDMGIMQGYPDGTFKPGQPITRAETVATVNRVLADMEVADYEVLPSDVTDAHWAYNDIVFAMNHRVLKDAAADPQKFIWSEQFDQNMIINTERVEGETVKVGEEMPAEGDTENKEKTSDNPDATAAENKEDTSKGDNAQTTE